MFRKMLGHFFSKPFNLATLNTVFLLILILGNLHWQVLCRPTMWAFLVLSGCFTTTIIYPLLKFNETKWHLLVHFITGVSVVVYLYFIVFLEHMNLYGFVFIIMGIGILTFIPHFLLIQLLWRYFKINQNLSIRKAFLIGVSTALLIVIFSGVIYNKALQNFKTYQKGGYKSVDPSFINEKVIGMHFIYHTRYCEYDGWRPPVHEPILVMGLWLNGRKDPLVHFSLEERINLYKKTFPNQPIRFSCTCATNGSKEYLRDNRLKK